MLNNLKKIFGWINDHLGALAIIGGVFWSFVTALWMSFALPLIDSHIDSRIMTLAEDSLGQMVDNHLKENGGFRGGFSEITGISKDSVVYALGSLYLKSKNIDTIFFSVNYQHGFDTEIMKMICSREEYNGVMFFVAPTGDVYYKDNKGFIWSANYSMADDCYYYYPPYNNNKRTKCL
jgi:hypothetical protein